MATTVSLDADRVARRRDRTREEALDHAQEIVTADGAGALSVAEVARRMGMRSPSLYKYFPSLHAVYDALFLRGQRQVTAYVIGASEHASPGLDRLLVASGAMARWSVSEPGLGTLMFSRPIPGFVPSPESFAPSRRMWAWWRADLTTAVAQGELAPAADSDEAMRLLTVLVSGVCSQQLANEPGVAYADGVFSRLTPTVLAMFVDHYSPSRSGTTPPQPGGTT